MNREEKQGAVDELRTRFGAAQAAFVVDFKGCTCQELVGLRNGLRSSGASLAIVKNTLAKRAIDGTDASGLSDAFEGSSAVIWSGQDVVAPAKVLTNFSKTKESFKVKAAVFEGEVLDAAGVESLSSMPSREEMLARLLALMNAPAIQLLRMINAPASSLARLLEAWRAELEKKDQS